MSEPALLAVVVVGLLLVSAGLAAWTARRWPVLVPGIGTHGMQVPAVLRRHRPFSGPDGPPCARCGWRAPAMFAGLIPEGGLCPDCRWATRTPEEWTALEARLLAMAAEKGLTPKGDPA